LDRPIGGAKVELRNLTLQGNDHYRGPQLFTALDADGDMRLAGERVDGHSVECQGTLIDLEGLCDAAIDVLEQERLDSSRRRRRAEVGIGEDCTLLLSPTKSTPSGAKIRAPADLGWAGISSTVRVGELIIGFSLSRDWPGMRLLVVLTIRTISMLERPVKKPP